MQPNSNRIEKLPLLLLVGKMDAQMIPEITLSEGDALASTARLTSSTACIPATFQYEDF